MHQTARLLIVALAIALTACSTLPPHNNTLIFAVHRKVGIDITPTNSTNAGLTIGYSSNEFAWVPLWANDGDGKPILECPTSKDAVMPTKKYKDKDGIETTVTPYCASKARFVGVDGELGTAGSRSTKDEDSYSVFASFGGAVAAKAGADQPTGSINIASFFATGIAAQNLAQRGSSLVAVAAADMNKKMSQLLPLMQLKNNY